MTTESAAPEVLHVWAIYMRASEEARRRGEQARQALESLDQEALGALGVGSGTDAPPLPMRAVPKKPTFNHRIRRRCCWALSA